MNRRHIATARNQFQRLSQKSKQISPTHLVEKETWKRLGHWIVWNISRKRRQIKSLTAHLIPLDPSAPAEIKALRDEVFALTCLQLKKMADRRNLLELLNGANKPAGFEQIFLSAIYPSILNRNLGITGLPTEGNHRLDVEIGYLGYNEDYFFWVFEIDGAESTPMDKRLIPQQQIRGDKRYVIYHFGAAGLVDEDRKWDACQWIINSQIYFLKILAELKRWNYKITAASVPHSGRGRLSLLRRLSLEDLRKHRSRSARRIR